MFQRSMNSWLAGAAILLAFAAPASAQTPAPDPGTPPATMTPAQPPRGNPIRFIAHLDGAQSEAVNSTDISTRVGTGTGLVTFDPISGDVTLDATFQGLIATDITLGDPAVNPDGTTPGPGTINGNSLPGGGLFLFHFHVGAPAKNGKIPIDVVARPGPVAGVTTDPTPIQGQSAGRIQGKFNIFQLAPNGVLLNGVPLDGREDNLRDPFCLNCGFIEGILSGNAYLNVHTFNNPFGEIRGQLEAVGCDPLLNINTLDALRNAVDALRANDDTRRAAIGLQARLAGVQRALDDGRNELARQLLAGFAGASVARSAIERLPIDAANNLVCGATNVLISIPLDAPRKPRD